jgi:hypothetical protein|tara:strand:+ start:513 stop:857 length:345 start_codon:yes stop_codon:yes gene_type:complete
MSYESELKEEKFKTYKATVHLKHTGTELIADVIGIREKEGVITVQNPCVLQSIPDGQGSSSLSLVPFLMTVQDDTIHIGMSDILFIAETRTEIADQHTSMFSAIIQPAGGKFIL